MALTIATRKLLLCVAYSGSVTLGFAENLQSTIHGGHFWSVQYPQMLPVRLHPAPIPLH
jgi:hypothetical protein